MDYWFHLCTLLYIMLIYISTEGQCAPVSECELNNEVCLKIETQFA